MFWQHTDWLGSLLFAIFASSDVTAVWRPVPICSNQLVHFFDYSSVLWFFVCLLVSVRRTYLVLNILTTIIRWYIDIFFCFAICLLDLFSSLFLFSRTISVFCLAFLLPLSLSLVLTFLCSFRPSSSYIVTLPPTVKCWFLFCYVKIDLYNIALYIFTEFLCFCFAVSPLWSCVVVCTCKCVCVCECVCFCCSVLNLYSIKHDYHHCSFLLFILFYTSVTEFVILFLFINTVFFFSCFCSRFCSAFAHFVSSFSFRKILALFSALTETHQ